MHDIHIFYIYTHIVYVHSKDAKKTPKPMFMQLIFFREDSLLISTKPSGCNEIFNINLYTNF